jgi:hypothetical protein
MFLHFVTDGPEGDQRQLLRGLLEMFALGFAASLRGVESFDGDRVFRLQGRDFDGATVAVDGDHREVAAVGVSACSTLDIDSINPDSDLH